MNKAPVEKEVSAGGIIFYAAAKSVKVLLIKDRYGRWTWPKGKLEKGETPAEAAVREISEETGLAVELIGEIGRTAYRYRRGGRQIDKTVTFFAARARDDLFTIKPDEVQEACWVSVPRAFGLVAYRGAHGLLRAALRSWSQDARTRSSGACA